MAGLGVWFSLGALKALLRQGITVLKPWLKRGMVVLRPLLRQGITVLKQWLKRGMVVLRPLLMRGLALLKPFFNWGVVALVLIALLYLILRRYGFTARGPAAGSRAAARMSKIAVATGTGVAAGSWYAWFQSFAMRRDN